MKKAVFPGSFDPITLGHVDIIERAARLFDEVIVVILNNSEKQTLFTLEQRMTFLNHALHHIPNVRCESDAGLTVEFAKREQACAIIRGV
ncbi:MAG: pantetheine-phosphate adenylyltransferase, partial [Longicatena sp.]